MIRFAEKEDITAVSRLWVKMVNELSPEWTPDRQAWVELSSSLFETGLYRICIAEDRGKVVGFLDGMFFYEPAESKTIGYGKSFYILPEYRGTGISQDLYSKLVSFGAENGAEEYELYCLDGKLEYWLNRGFKKKQHVLRSS